MKNIRIFALNGTKPFAESICDYLDIPLSGSTEKHFSDKESYLKSDVNVRGTDVFIITTLHTDENETVNDKLVKLLIFIGALRDASAERITAVIPYLPYQRQDRKVESRAPITTKYLAILIESLGLNRVLSMDVHDLKVFQNAFRIPTDQLEAKNLAINYLVKELKDEVREIAILAPDSGGVPRADRFQKKLSAELNRQINLVHMAKIREGSVVKGSRISDDVKDKVLIAVDDMISSGGTLAECSRVAALSGASLYAVFATHPLLVGNNVSENLEKIERIIVTDTIPSQEYIRKSKIKNNSFIYCENVCQSNPSYSR